MAHPNLPTFVDLQGYAKLGTQTTCASGPLGAAVTNNSNCVTGVSFASGLLGKIDANDTFNSTLQDGLGTASSSVTDWLSFQNFYRQWGLNGDSFPAVSNRGRCTGSGCKIWDWRVRDNSGTGPLLNNSLTGGAPDSNGTFIPGSACPSAVNGNEADTANSKTFLRHALEINDDSIGNNNGLCESGEACVYAPNPGAYQGEGALTGSCNFTPGTVTGVTIYAYPTIGI